ncbi:MAG: hypothetical protein P8163_21075 [Candidatus Thiodiazotropha sp.]
MTAGVQNQTAVAATPASGDQPTVSKDQGAETSTTLERFRDSPTTSEQILNRPTAITQQLAQRLEDNCNRSDPTGKGGVSVDQESSVEAESDPALKDGIPISDEEFSLLTKGDFKEFWRSRYQANDPVARTALTGWGDPDFVDASLFERAAAQHTWSDLSGYIEANNLPVTMEEIGLELAVAHADAVMNDDQGSKNLLSPHQVADYHHTVFAKHGIPAHLFGGTHQIGGHWYLPDISVPSPGGWAPTRFDANAYSGLWCKGCDVKP